MILQVKRNRYQYGVGSPFSKCMVKYTRSCKGSKVRGVTAPYKSRGYIHTREIFIASSGISCPNCFHSLFKPRFLLLPEMIKILQMALCDIRWACRGNGLGVLAKGDNKVLELCCNANMSRL